jgi:hypothetical protein
MTTGLEEPAQWIEDQEISFRQHLNIMSHGLEDVTSVDGTPRGFCPGASKYADVNLSG